MKKSVFVIVALMLAVSAKAQEEKFYGLFNRLGADVNVASTGIGFDLATPITPYLELSAGMSFMPGFSLSGDVDVNDITTQSGLVIPMDQVEIKGKFSRTTMNVKLSCYPFGERNALFVAAGFSFAGKKIVKLNGHSEDVRRAIAEHPEIAGTVHAELDKYQVTFNDNGDITGDARVNGFRPYVGLGYGRLVPKHRLGFRVEAGCMFHGRIKVYQGDHKVLTSEIDRSTDDLSKFIKNFRAYPVLKFSLTGRIL